jgi:hypothetical protein
MKKYFFSITVFVLSLMHAEAQELNCNVTIIQPQVIMADPQIFQSMESTIEEFINNRRWSKDDWQQSERIDCNMQITVESQPSQRQFKGSIQIGSSRPVYNSDYKTPVVNINDRDFEFTFNENTQIVWSVDQHRDNLSSVLAFYANLILASDYDSFSPEGGTEHYLICQTIVANAQNAAEPGWRANEKGQQNRYWLIENIVTQTFKPLRDALYSYHRKGMDKMFTELTAARKIMSDAILALNDIHKIKPSSYNMQVFFYAKSDEIINIFKPLPVEEKQPVYEMLKKLDPGNIMKYDKMMK